jgi:hypothetical protein
MQTGGQAVATDRRPDLPSPVADGSGENVTVARPKVDKPQKVYTWICQYCIMPFETDNYNQRYCKPSHKQRAYEQRKAERMRMLQNSLSE